jgi:hypothetical protein
MHESFNCIPRGLLPVPRRKFAFVTGDHMKRILVLSIALASISGASVSGLAFAQSSTERTTTAPPAVSSPSNAAKTTAAPVAGANSFTEKEAMKRLEDHGYSQVNSLTKDDKSIWHAKAMKAGRSTMVSLDYQGNITEN